MKRKKHFFLIFFPFFILASLALLTSGCGDKEQTDDYGNAMVKDDLYVKVGENIPDPTLSAGQILLVRLIYNYEEGDNSDTEWYKVKLKRADGHWSDSVKIQGIIRSETRHHDDYTFGAKNFNFQLENKQYGLDTLDGHYELIIEGSNGYYDVHKLHWSEGRWTNARPTLTFSVR